MDHTRRLLDRIGVLRHPCDLDLLVFFVRHPRTLMASEQLAAFLGYDLKQISDSLDILLETGLLTRTSDPTLAARMYVFAIGGTNGGGLPELLELASTREGRLILRREMKRRALEATTGPAARTDGRVPTPQRGPRPFRITESIKNAPESIKNAPEPIEDVLEPTGNAEPRARRAGGR